MLGKKIRKSYFNQTGRQRSTTQICKSNNSVKCTFQFSNIGLNTLGNDLQNFIRYIPPGSFGFRAQNCKTGFRIRWLDISRQAPLEAGAQSFVQCDQGFWRAVRGDNDLLVLPVQGIESVEEFLLFRFFSLYELNI